MTNQSYQTYQNSPISGLNCLPAHWRISRLKDIASVSFSNVDKHKKKGEIPVQLCNYTDVYNNDFITERIDFMEATATQTEIERFTLQRGDVLITKDSESWDDIAVPAHVSQTFENVLCGYHLALIRPHAIDSRYLFRTFSTYEINIQFSLSVSGVTRFGLGKSAITNATFPIPPYNEQIAIADYLDRETEKIDKLVTAMNQLLAVLVKKRQAVITHAVTRGFNPNVPLRDSGVEWIGDIPAHWGTEYARWLFAKIDCRSETGSEELLTVSHLTGVTPRSEKDVNMFMAENLVGYKICKAGDLVINTLWAWMGAMGVAFQKGIVSPAYHIYRSTGEHIPAYIDYLVRMKIFAQEVTRYSKGVWSSRLRLYPEGFFEVVIPVPPIKEQQKIVKYLTEETSKIDVLQSQIVKAIDLLRKRRASLISAAVTGQIRVTA